MIRLAWEKGKKKRGEIERWSGEGEKAAATALLASLAESPTELSKKFSSYVIYTIIETFIGRVGVGVW